MGCFRLIRLWGRQAQPALWLYVAGDLSRGQQGASAEVLARQAGPAVCSYSVSRHDVAVLHR